MKPKNNPRHSYKENDENANANPNHVSSSSSQGNDRRNNKQQERLTRRQLRQQRDKKRYGDPEWKREFDLFLEQLKVIGLTIKDVAGDGNCLFRAIADQMEGNPNNHAKWRKDICKYIEDHRMEYEPFIEDDETFDQYITQMKRNATWGGQMEIQAFSVAFTVNVTIHQLGQPRWDIINFPPDHVKTIHLSYHDGQHYSSVRKIGDTYNGSTPREIKIESKAPPKQVKEEKIYVSENERTVMEMSGCHNLEFVRLLLKDNYDSVDETLEFLLTIQPDEQFQLDYVQDKKGHLLYDKTSPRTTTTTTTSTSTYDKTSTKKTATTDTTANTKQQKQTKNETKPPAPASPRPVHEKMAKFKNNQLSNKERKEQNKKLARIDNVPPRPKPPPEQQQQEDLNSTTAVAALDLGSMTI